MNRIFEALIVTIGKEIRLYHVYYITIAFKYFIEFIFRYHEQESC